MHWHACCLTVKVGINIVKNQVILISSRAYYYMYCYYYQSVTCQLNLCFGRVVSLALGRNAFET